MILVDAHVHIHKCFDIATFLSSMAENFTEAAHAHGFQKYHAVACLTESSGIGFFDEFRACAPVLDDWMINETAEPESLTLTHRVHGSISFLAGCQIVTRERLEILALGTNTKFADDVGIEDTIRDVYEAAAIPVLPWGFGKWLGIRGRLVRQLLETHSPKRLYIGDNSGRFRWMPQPKEFVQARRSGFKLLPGSDPFPFPRETGRAGSYGFYLDGYLNMDTPARDLKALLNRVSGASIHPYGTLETPLRFVRNQIAMQLRS